MNDSTRAMLVCFSFFFARHSPICMLKNWFTKTRSDGQPSFSDKTSALASLDGNRPINQLQNFLSLHRLIFLLIQLKSSHTRL